LEEATGKPDRTGFPTIKGKFEGYQPAMIEELSQSFSLRVIDFEKSFNLQPLEYEKGATSS